jgi:hypothetical protein
MNKTSQELHYTRAIRFIDKLYALVEDGKYNKEEEKNFFVNLALYKNKSPIFLYDLNNFMLACCVGVFGLNKESIEGASRDRNYSFNVHYLIFSKFQNKKFNLKEINEIDFGHFL